MSDPQPWHFTTLLDLVDHWQTLIAGGLAVLAAWRTIRATTQSADREVDASQKQTAVAQKQIETTVQLERQRDTLRERDRTERAEVVAFRLSGWLREVGPQIERKSQLFNSLRTHNHEVMPQPTKNLTDQFKLDVVASIENVLSELHYLQLGSGDVARLEYYVKYFDAYLDDLSAKTLRKLTLGTPTPYNATDLDRIYKDVDDQLKRMQRLHANAERHLNPIIQATIERER
jgi:hypothetical protein